MQKRLVILLILTNIYYSANSQLKVGNNATTINSNANLQAESSNGGQFIITKDSMKVGIGTLIPAASLDVNGSVKISDGTQGTGKVLVSDNNGLASWKTIASITGPWYNVATNIAATSNVQSIYQMGNVAIGTNSAKSTLSVNGSFGANYIGVSSTSYNILDSDYYINYEGNATANFYLPIGTSTNCNCEGRTYVIMNPSNYTVFIIPNPREMISGLNSISLDPNQSVAIVNTNSVSGNTWKVITYGTINKPLNNYELYYTDANGRINTPETASLNYSSMSSSDVTLSVPSGYTNNKVILNWSVWGDVSTTSAANGSLRFSIEQTYNGVVSLISSVMMTSWALSSAGQTRFNCPPSIVLSNLAAGAYTFKLQVVRESENGTIVAVPTIYGVAAKGDVFVKR